MRRALRIPLLELPGLDKTTAAVYQVLLTTDGSSADLAKITRRPQKDIRAALEALLRLNLVRAPRDGANEWRPVPPQLGFAALVQRHEADLARTAQELAALRAAAATAAAAWSTRLPPSAAVLVEYLEDSLEVWLEVQKIINTASTDLLQVLPTWLGPPEARQEEHRLEEDALARGVKIRALYPDSVLSDPEALAHARQRELAGAEVRTTPILPPPLWISDQQIAIISMSQELQEWALCIREPRVVAALNAVFYSDWDVAAPLSAARSIDEETGLTADERRLLRLLAAGLTDEAAAKRLGVSLRTVRRRMQSLMERLPASSRFQAGYKAAERGWL